MFSGALSTTCRGVEKGLPRRNQPVVGSSATVRSRVTGLDESDTGPVRVEWCDVESMGLLLLPVEPLSFRVSLFVSPVGGRHPGARGTEMGLWNGLSLPVETARHRPS